MFDFVKSQFYKTKFLLYRTKRMARRNGLFEIETAMPVNRCLY